MKIKRIIAAIITAAITASMAVIPVSHAEEMTGMIIYVAPNGNDSNDGSEASPLASMKGARDKIRQIKASGLPENGITVVFRGGYYQWDDTLEFTQEDSGTEKGKIVYRSYPGEKAVMEAGIRIPGSDFVKVTNEDILMKWSNAKAKENIRQIDIKSYMAKRGYTNLGDYYPQIYDIYHLSGDYQRQSEEIKAKYGERTKMNRPIYSFDDESALLLARYPNKEGGWYPEQNPQTKFLKTGEVLKNGGTTEPSTFKYSERRISKYAGRDDVYLFGHLGYLFYHDEIKININAEQQTISTVVPMSIGVRADMDYIIFNIIEELDAPGEYFVDKNTGMMYVYPKGDIATKTLNVSLLDKKWMLKTNNTSNVTFSGLTFENSKGGAIQVDGGENVRIEYCDFKNLGTDAVEMGVRKNMAYTNIGDPSEWKDYDKETGDNWWQKQTNHWRRDDKQVAGKNHGLYGCRISNTGQNGVIVSGGNLHTDELSGYYIENCIFEYIALYKRTYAPAISLNTIHGLLIKDNVFRHIPAAAINGYASVMTVQGNDFYDTMSESNDQGIIYLNYQYPNLDVKFIDNYLHDTPPEHEIKSSTSIMSQRSGVAFDNSYGGGVEYTNNVFANVPKGLFMRNNIIYNNNVMVDSFTPIQVSEGVTNVTPTVPDQLTKESIAPLFSYTRFMLGWPIWDEGSIGQEMRQLWTEKYPSVMEWVDIVKSKEADGKSFYEAKNNLFVNKNVPLHSGTRKIGTEEMYTGSNRKETVNNIYTDDTSMFVDYANRNYQLTAEGSAKYGNTLNLSTVGPKIDMVGAEKYAEAKVALPKANGKAPAAPSVSMPEKVKDAVILRMQSANAWANGKISKIDSANSAVMPKIVDGRTLVPARFISESFGGEVGWNADTRTVTIKINGKTVELTIDNKDLIIDGAKAAEMDVPAQIIESRTMVPLRVLCETVLGKKVFWDPMGLIVISNEDILDASADADIIKTTFDLLK